MSNRSGSRGFVSRRLGLLAVAVGLVALLAFVAVPWFCRGVGAWPSEVRVISASLHSPDRLVLYVDSCHGSPEVSLLQETDVEVQVKIVAWVTPLLGGLDCADGVQFQLQEPLEDRVVVDKHAGETVSVSTDSLYPDARPSSDWIEVEVPGWPSQTGFSLRLPPGWELNEVRGGDSYVSELVGDGVRLTFDYGEFTSSLDPVDDPENAYAVNYWYNPGVAAKLLISLTPGAGYTGIYFSNLGGSSLNLLGEGLTLEQQRTAVAVFRSIRLLAQ